MEQDNDRTLVRRAYRQMVRITNRYKSEVTAAMRETSRALGLSGSAKFSHYDVLCELYHAQGALAPSAISEAVGVTLPNVLNSVNELCELGLAEREVDDGDRRRSLVRITRLGREFGDRIMSSYVSNPLAPSIGHDKLAELADLLDECLKAEEG